MSDAKTVFQELVKRLVATGKLELATARTEDSLPAKLEESIDLEDKNAANAIGEQLADLEGVVELYATDEEIAALLVELRT